MTELKYIPLSEAVAKFNNESIIINLLQNGPVRAEGRPFHINQDYQEIKGYFEEIKRECWHDYEVNITSNSLWSSEHVQGYECISVNETQLKLKTHVSQYKGAKGRPEGSGKFDPQPLHSFLNGFSKKYFSGKINVSDLIRKVEKANLAWFKLSCDGTTQKLSGSKPGKTKLRAMINEYISEKKLLNTSDLKVI